ncbi:hypothetical protein LINGRAHAP2_LOCUS12101, partial [Linum grandiflorum]
SIIPSFKSFHFYRTRILKIEGTISLNRSLLRILEGRSPSPSASQLLYHCVGFLRLSVCLDFKKLFCEDWRGFEFEFPSMAGLCINDVLTPDTLTEVFSRVPLVDLFRCKTVCRLWLSSIDNTAFVSRFILRRVRELSRLNEDEEDKKLIHVPWNERHIFTLTPTCYCADFSKFSLDFLPILEGLELEDTSLNYIVLGSSNGLLLCTRDIAFGERYCICNPITKKWLELPPFPPCEDNMDVKVGFVCDPFYHFDEDDGSVILNSQFGVKVVRLVATRYNKDEDVCQNVDVEVFSSQTGFWTTSYRVPLPDHMEYMLEILCDHMVAYDGKLYWIVEEAYDILVYDINKGEFLMDRLNPPSDALRFSDQNIAPYEGLSLCQGSLWVAQIRQTQLRVFVLADGQWYVKHDVDVRADMEWIWPRNWSRSDVQYFVFRCMHPSDPMVGYLSTDDQLLECNFESKTVTVLIDIEKYSDADVGEPFFYVQPVDLPLWPTPLPLLPNA